MRKTFLVFLSFISISYWIVSASAGGPVFWRVNTRAEIEKGDARGVSIADNGALTLAPALIEVFDTKQAYIWSAAADKAGNIYLGTGHEGRVFKVDPSGKGTLLYKTSELDVMALAVDAQGNVYAGTAPDGKVYRIAPGGEAKVVFEPKTKYIWSLGVASSGASIAGTDPGGMVLRISPEGKVFTLFDSSLREIRDLALGRNDEIYALALAESAGIGATNASPASGQAAPQTPAPSSSEDGNVTITISDLQIVDTASATPSVSSSASGQSKSAVYRLDANGASDTIWDSKETVAFALAADGDGRVLVGTGQKGRIYQAAAGEKPRPLAKTSEAQTSRLIRAGAGANQLFAAASNLGKLFRVSNETAASGTYTSSVRDAQTSAEEV